MMKSAPTPMPARWRRLKALGALILMAAPVSAQMVFSEIHYHPVGEPAFHANGVAGKIYQLATSSDLECWNPLEGSTVLAGAAELFVRVKIVP